MKDSKFGRRGFLTSTAAAAIGITGGIAASGTAAANKTDEYWQVALWSEDDYDWEYEFTVETNDGQVEKGILADDDDEIFGYGDIIHRSYVELLKVPITRQSIVDSMDSPASVSERTMPKV